MERAMEAMGVKVCEGTSCLVGENVRRESIEAGKKSSTVLVKVRGEEVANRLFRMGIWVGGRWCSIRQFVAILAKQKQGWRGEVRDVRVRLDGLCRAGERMEDKVLKKIGEMEGMCRKRWILEKEKPVVEKVVEKGERKEWPSYEKCNRERDVMEERVREEFMMTLDREMGSSDSGGGGSEWGSEDE